MKVRFLSFLIACLVRIIRWTSRRIYLNEENINKAKELAHKNSYALAVWHRNLAGGIIALREPIVSMVSKSKDGDFAAHTSSFLGIKTVRGSSSRGGREAMQAMIEYLKENALPCALTVDGPRGPAEIPKKGIFKIAHDTQIPIVPYHILSSRTHTFVKSWDKFRLPLPFGKIYISYGTPFMVESIDDQSIEKYSKMLIEEQKLLENHTSALISNPK